jgi:hypothetical protein
MTRAHVLGVAIAAAIALVAPVATAQAQAPRGPQTLSTAYDAGYTRGVSAGEQDGRRGDAFNFTDETDYRRADAGWRSQYGNADRYRTEFRRGYEAGYRTGYARYDRRGDRGPYDDRYGAPGGRYGAPGPGRGAPGYGGYGRTDLAFEKGYTDGYDEGLKDGRGGRRNDPFAESRYRNGDHGYERWYGTKDLYRINYREAFRRGYEQGWSDGRRYDNRRGFNAPGWWPF